ncbi:C-type lectin domain family 4 member M-like isoform X1 [Micropterus dolomieu]|uniref:C-type lectin domain family 4 member M-like isoform X1 n=1 Tax=Micropterus dolomieu TaxID=147949 RepID=UPI001E8D80A6|nr:C-type lectin domain family 4 member M-like isoform X1 [Micropterus dolomieu]
MEEELNYATVTFNNNGTFINDKPNNLEVIYDEVKTGEQARDTNPDFPENEKKALVQWPTLLHLVAASLGIICVILVSVVIALSIHFSTIMSEQYRENINLTAMNQQLWTEKTDLEKQTAELTREKDGLNWTIGVILEYKNFPVNTHCPQKVCKPCLDGWVLFQSNCYLFSKSNYYPESMGWQGSRDQCKQKMADLVVIESQEEQEFINNHTKDYKHGYWIGLSYRNTMDTWMWVDGSNFTLMYWVTQQPGNQGYCALTPPSADPLANWHKVNCNLRNRWICETRALIKPDEESASLSK